MSTDSRSIDSGAAGGPMIRALVADDDPASCRFLGDALRAMGADVATCADGLRALALARQESFDLLLLDCHMPGIGALAIVQAVRTDARAASRGAAVVATSAELALEERRALLAAGCNGTLDKPCSLAGLRETLALIPAVRNKVRLLDDDAGLRNSGDRTTLDALCRLLRDELSVLEQQLDRLGKDPVDLGNRLHRLRAACGFCGTIRMAHAAQALQRQLVQGDTHAAAINEFRVVLRDTLRTLRERLPDSTSGAGHGQHLP